MPDELTTVYVEDHDCNKGCSAVAITVQALLNSQLGMNSKGPSDFLFTSDNENITFKTSDNSFLMTSWSIFCGENVL